MTTEKRRDGATRKTSSGRLWLLVTEQGYKISEAARSLDIGANLLGRWRRQFEEEASGSPEAVTSVRAEAASERESAAADGKGDFKKSQPVLREGNEVKYGFIRDHASRYPVNMLCRLLTRSAQRLLRLARIGHARSFAQEELALRRRMKELFAASRCSLGSRTMMKNLRQEGFEIGRDKDASLDEADCSLKVRQKRKYKVTHRQQAQSAGGEECVEP